MLQSLEIENTTKVLKSSVEAEAFKITQQYIGHCRFLKQRNENMEMTGNSIFKIKHFFINQKFNEFQNIEFEIWKGEVFLV